jgi:hypothetical protein
MILIMRKARLSQKTNSGNILFLILIAVALFAALSYTVTQMGRTPGNTIEDEKAKLSQAQIDSYMAQINQGKSRLQLINNCKSIDYAPPANQVVGDKTCHMFHPDGAGVAYIDFGDTCPSDDLLAGLAIGGRCGLITYAGSLSGTRLYTTPSDQGRFTWGPTGVTSATSLSDGMANTNSLIPLGNHPAAEACRSLGEEWYLPALDEIQVLKDNQNEIGNFNIAAGPFVDCYWTSYAYSGTGAQTHIAYCQPFAGAHHGVKTKSSASNVRCVRR